MKVKFITAILLSLSAGILAADRIPSPEEFLGFEVGGDRKVADMYQIHEYFLRLGRASPRIRVEEIGKTTEGHPFIVALITSEENQGNLEVFRDIQQKLADPRTITEAQAQEMIRRGKTVVMINCSIHASEIGAAQMSMRLAYDLAVGSDDTTREILDNVILILTPMHNPDGIQMVVDWYRKYLGTDYEGGRMPWLYHKYVGHDNNRDWYMFTQVESRLTLKIHNAWHPQVVVDMHQMGNRAARLFVPPYVDPYEPNIDPILRQQVAMMGTFIAAELTAQGKSGVMHSDRYDAWTPARAYQHYHGGVRILTEAASVNVASPVDIPFERLSENARSPSVKMPLPWNGGTWRLKDIVEYDYAAAKAALTNAARLRLNWLRNFYLIHRNAVAGGKKPAAYVIPGSQRDLPSAVRMLQTLALGGVEIHRTEASFRAGGRDYGAGSYLIPLAQPYGGYAKALLERQVYPEIREVPGGPLKTPYDVVGHTLPLLMGVEAVEIIDPPDVPSVQVEKVEKPAGTLDLLEDAFGYAWGYASNDDILALNRLLKMGHSVIWLAEKGQTFGAPHPPGLFVVRFKSGLEEDLQELTRSVYVRFRGLKEKPAARSFDLEPVRLGLYKSWTASMDEGWARWVLEQFEFPYSSVLDEDIRSGDLRKVCDVLIVPDLRENEIVRGNPEDASPPEYAGGIGDVGIENIRTFIRAGGVLITLNNAAEFAVQHFGLDVENVVGGLDRRDFFIPGSLLRVENNTDHPIAFGFEEESAVFFRQSPAFRIGRGASVVEYTPDGLLSGWATGGERLTKTSAVVETEYGQGRIMLLGFPALYRGQSHGTFRYLFNSILYGGAAAGEDGRP